MTMTDTPSQPNKTNFDVILQVLRAAPLVLWAVDANGNHIFAEGAGLARVGISPEDAPKVNILDMFKDQPDIMEGFTRALAGEHTRMMTNPVPEVHFESWAMPLREHAGGPIMGVVGIAIDATDRVKTEMEVRDKLDLIQRQSATIRSLATPIIQVWDEVICLPVIGTVDSARTADMMQSLLETIVREQARFAIVDLTGVEVVDTSTADHLIQLFRAAKVLGVEGILCGIRPAVAQTIVALGLELASVRTMRSLRDALKWCIRARTKPATATEHAKEAT
jgi:rsbT co-antagonist protein RsbR